MMQGISIKRIRRRPTLPPSRPGSTIGAEELNFRDRNGNGCSLLAIATENLYIRFDNCRHIKIVNIIYIKKTYDNWTVLGKKNDTAVMS